MVAAGELNEDEAEEWKALYITEVTDYLATQESIVFFDVGYGENDEERQLYMTHMDNWIRASTGYEEVCHQLDEGDVDTLFSTISDQTFVDLYGGHVWYSGFNCLDDGSGFGSQLFLDENCDTYAPSMSNYYPFPDGTQVAADNANEENQANVDYSNRVSSDMTPYMIQNADYFLQSVHYCEEVEGANEEQGGNQDEAGQDIEFCQNLLKVSVDVVTCNLYGEEGNENQQQQCECAEEDDAQDEAQDEAQDGAEEQDEGNMRRRNQECDCAQQADNGYQVNYDEIGDVEASCSSIRTALEIDPDTFNGVSAEYVVSSWSNAKDGHQPTSTQTSKNNKGWIIAIVVVAIVAVLAMIAFVSRRGKNKTETECSKIEPLVSSTNKPARKKKESIEIYFQGSKLPSSTVESSRC
jgi:hypothetical protein